MPDEVIRVRNLSKRYRIGQKEDRPDTIIGNITRAVQKPLRNFRRLRSLSTFGDNGSDVIWALQDISFGVQEGEVLGIIGPNGAGKTTLLKILGRITEPTRGSVRLRGRVSALLEIGTGFHPELTGRENIHMNGTLLGMTRREIASKFDEIVFFSGIKKYVDTPVKFYSSGMRVRLGFSVAAHLEPEIMLIDEVLAVGDAEFQKKCLGKMENISRENGRTLLFVSHNLAAVQSICRRAIVLKDGMIAYAGNIVDAVNAYSANLQTLTAEASGAGSVPIINDSLNGQGLTTVGYDEPMELQMRIRAGVTDRFSVYLIIQNAAGENVVHDRLDDIEVQGAGKTIRFLLPPLWLRPGVYSYFFKIISVDAYSSTNRYVSEAFSLKITGNVETPKMIGSITPRITYRIDEQPYLVKRDKDDNTK